MYKTIEEFPNYEINENGEVRNKKKGNILKWNITKNGYAIVRMYKDGKQYGRNVHRLLLMAHKPVVNMDELQVNHIDENKLNNTLDNLE